MSEELKTLAQNAFDDFYNTLEKDTYLKGFFTKVDMKDLKKRQVENFLEVMQMDAHKIHKRFIRLGDFHYKLGLPYSRYIKSFNLLLKSMTINLSKNKDSTDLLQKIQLLIEEAINGSAIGYLNRMINYDLIIIKKLLQESLSQRFVNEHLFWIERVCFDIKNFRKTPSVELDNKKCLLGKWLHTCEKEKLLSQKDLERLHYMHDKIHANAKSLYDALEKKDYHSLLIDYSFLVRHSQHINYELHQVVTQKILLEKSHTDFLTKLPNRSSLEEKIKTFKLHKKANFALGMLDLDYFKNINDKYGHLCGDYILQEVGAILKESLRKSDYVFRYGGEEFLLILNDTDAKEVLTHLEKLRKKIEKKKFVYKGEDIFLTVSMGVSHFNYKKHKNLEDIISAADDALYLAKEAGRNSVKIN